MPIKALVTDDKYKGLYVALKSFTDNEVIASGKDPANVLKEATAKGAEEPVIVFVCDKESIYNKIKFDNFGFDWEKILAHAETIKNKEERIEYLKNIKAQIRLKKLEGEGFFKATRASGKSRDVWVSGPFTTIHRLDQHPFMKELNASEEIVNSMLKTEKERLEIERKGKTEPKKDIVEKIPWHGNRGELARLIKSLIQKGYLKTPHRHKFTKKFFCKGSGEDFNPRTQSSAEDDTTEDKLNAIDELVNRLQG